MTTTATSRRAQPDATALAQRTKLCRELLKLEKKNATDVARMKILERELKQIATDAGDGFRENIKNLGTVTVAAGKAAEFKGNVPQIQTEAWLALKPAERKKLEKSGIVAMVAQWGSKFYGKVTVDLV